MRPPASAPPTRFVHEYFRAATPPYAARDARQDKAIVLVLGHWVDAEGREIAIQIAGTSSRRRLLEVLPLAAPPPSSREDPPA